MPRDAKKLTDRHQILNAKGRSAFTLLEMVVVIAILAILALVAVRSLSGIEDQTRFDVTRSQLGNIDQAVLGNPIEHDVDGSPYILSFVGDMGRLPQAIGADPTTQLQELWSNPNNLFPLAPRQSASDPDVWLTTGWRGGYVRLGIDQTTLQDGWSNPYDLLHADGVTPCAAGDPIEIIRSRGADALVDTSLTTGFNADQYLAFNNASATAGLPIQNRYASTVTGRVYVFDSTSNQQRDVTSANGDVVVKFFAPDPGTGGIAEAPPIVILAGTGFTSVSYSFPTVTVGPRVIRAYQGAGIGAASAMPATFAAATFYSRSNPVRLTVASGGVIKDLVLLPPTTQPTTQP